MTKIKVILGTTRQGRFGEQPANWALDLAKQNSDAEFELIDLRDLNLPLFDEATPPAAGKPLTSEVGQKWAAMIGEADGYIIVTGEYDHTIPASLTNAIQYLAGEWTNKPVSYIGYGAEGGGARAIEHLRGIAGQLSMFDITQNVLIHNYWNQLDGDGKWSPSDSQVDGAKSMVEKLVFWAQIFKDARTKI